MIDYLSKAKDNVMIAQGLKNLFDEKTNTVGFNPNSTTNIPTEGGNSGLSCAPTFISLSHELAHAEDKLKGTLNTLNTWIGTTNYSESEKYSTHRENQFRSENGLPLRTHYGVIQVSPTTYSPDPLNQIINKACQSLIYPKVKYR